MNLILLTLATLLIATVGAGFTFLYAGTFSVAATEPHNPFTRWLLTTARTRSIKSHAAGLVAPTPFSEAQVVGGANHFDAHCAMCHGAPGAAQTALARGLSPPPPDLSHASDNYTPQELFWIVKNGIKMTGMPSWASHGDDELWNVVAFLEKLPALSPEEYAKLVAVAATRSGAHHHAPYAEKDADSMDAHNMHEMHRMPEKTTSKGLSSNQSR